MSSGENTARGRHWAQVNEAGFIAGMRLLFWICRTFGRWPFRLVLYPVLAWYVATKPQARRASQAYLRRVQASGATGARQGLAGVMRHFGAFAECILDKMLLWGGLLDVGHTVFSGEQQIVADIAAGRGGLMICSHFGNLELCRLLARRRAGLKITVLVHTRHAEKFNRLLAQLDPASQLNLLQVTEMTPATAMRLSEAVGRGEFVVIAGDRVPVSAGSRTCEALFLGERAAFPVGPYVLASLLQCPVYMQFSMRTPNGFEVHFERLRDQVHLPRKGRQQAFEALAADYAARLSHYCLRMPYQWFNFYDFWQLPEMEQPHASR